MTDGSEAPRQGPGGPPSDRSESGGPSHPGKEEPRDEAQETGSAESAACEICGAPVLERHCKIVCLNCGYTRDCSDP